MWVIFIVIHEINKININETELNWCNLKCYGIGIKILAKRKFKQWNIHFIRINQLTQTASKLYMYQLINDVLNDVNIVNV